MNCQDLVGILDDHAVARLEPARIAELNAHLDRCVRCSGLWQAHHELRSRPVPPMPPRLLADTRRLVAAAAGGEAPPSVTARRTGGTARRFTWRFAVGAGALAAGAVLAAVGVVSMSDRSEHAAPPRRDIAAPAETVIDGSADIRPAGARGAEGSATAAPRAAAADTREATGAPLADTESPRTPRDGEYFALLKVAPRYPAEAARRGIEGSVIVEFTVSETGDVADVVAIESSDGVFEQAAVDAARQFKYMPQISGGVPVAVPGVRNRIAFKLENPASSDSPASEYQAMTGIPDPSMRPRFWDIVAPALECASAGDLLCAELVLDEASAIYDLNSAERRAVWKFYGFIYARLEDYERAITAYERAASIPGAFSGDTTLLTVAHLYFRRQQYVSALESALEYIERAEPTGRAIPSAYMFADRLRQLGADVP